MSAENRKVLIVIPNEDMRQTIMLTVSEYFNRRGIYLSDNEQDALWQATDLHHQLIIVAQSSQRVKPNELIKRLKNSLPPFQGIVVYAPESEEYEKELLDAVSRDREYDGIILARIDRLGDILSALYPDGRRNGGFPCEMTT